MTKKTKTIAVYVSTWRDIKRLADDGEQSVADFMEGRFS